MSDMTYSEFIDKLASNSPAPGGGGAAALCGAIGTALGNMVGSLTVGKKKYIDVEDLMQELKTRCDKLQAEFLELINEDAECFLPLAAAYRLPKDTPEEIAARDAELERCSCIACSVPIKIMEKCAQAMDIIEIFALKGSTMAVSDAGCGMIICKAAMQAASLNVFINTKDMKDRAQAESFNAKVRELLYIYESKADNIFEMVSNKLTGRKKKEYPFEADMLMQ
ncbi:MAG: cyclodeaminase/cyclohydrolase family protein [Lachnospiraceae bacterium]|nr:cyclodeaminase/cyclohydrolase family protein [Lachnospiraceae bacterium]